VNWKDSSQVNQWLESTWIDLEVMDQKLVYILMSI